MCPYSAVGHFELCCNLVSCSRARSDPLLNQSHAVTSRCRMKYTKTNTPVRRTVEQSLYRLVGFYHASLEFLFCKFNAPFSTRRLSQAVRARLCDPPKYALSLLNLAFLLSEGGSRLVTVCKLLQNIALQVKSQKFWLIMSHQVLLMAPEVLMVFVGTATECLGYLPTENRP